MKNYRKENGITLIALIITIIVMLILVAVTINMAVNGGLFGYAQNAAKGTKDAKDAELGWANLQDGLTTDQLIAKFTTDREAILKLLERAFINDDQDAWDILNEDNNFLYGDRGNGTLIYYLGSYYKYFNDANDNKGKVGVLNEKEELIGKIGMAVDNGDAQWYVNNQIVVYNNNFYKVVESEDTIFGGEYQNIGSANEIAIVYTFNGDYIVIRPTANQTWTNWASTAGGEDLTVGNTTLKQLINSNTGSILYDAVDGVLISNYNTTISTGTVYFANDGK